jgi:YesN/AraC family two-component response regulator
MYRVMIIDDEQKIKNLLKLTIKWEMLGFEVVGEASSGIEAINTIDELNPDVLFVDIRMPFMDGIEFAKLAIERYPYLKIVMLTAFNDFDYARECIGIGVTNYLLKPINKIEINDTLTNIKKELDRHAPREEREQVDEVKLSSIGKVREYVIEHFKEPELNLTSVALKFGFNASYLSRAFKEETGVSFIDFLNGCRMEYAISLSKENQYMYQVAAEVGIPDPNYFGKCFKKYTGLSFSNYIKENKRE